MRENETQFLSAGSFSAWSQRLGWAWPCQAGSFVQVSHKDTVHGPSFAPFLCRYQPTGLEREWRGQEPDAIVAGDCFLQTLNKH